MRLKTSHGTYVIAGQDGEILHYRETPDLDLGSVWGGAPPPAPALGLMEAAVTKGPLAPSTLVVLADGFVAFRRDGLYLCADPRSSELRFDRESVGAWERFAIATVDGAVVRQTTNDASRDGSWVELQFVPPSFRASFASSLDEFCNKSSVSWHIRDGNEYKHAPITSSHEHLRLFQKQIKTYYPTKFGEYDEISCYINKEKSKFLSLADGAPGLIFDNNYFLTSELFINNAYLPKYIVCEDGGYKIDRAYTSSILEETESVFIFYDGSYKNYYHWWVESIVNFEIAAYYLGYMPTAIIWNGKPELSRWQLDSLDLLGIKVVHRTSEKTDIVRVKEVTWIDQNDICYVPAFIFRRLRQRVLAATPAPATSENKIYIKRRGSREVLNNDEVEKFLISEGYESVFMEDLSQIEQIALFRGASSVIAAHGAGLTNMLFMPEGSSVIELMLNIECRTFFWLMAEKLKIKYGVLMCNCVDEDFNSAVSVDLSELKRLLVIMDAHAGFPVHLDDCRA